MTGRQGNRPAAGNNVRQNEYFVPRDGIDREVITADICRYLGNDALVRPGNYHDDATNRTIQGYYVTAYRNLTTAMIADLKNDSARWEQERRKLQSGAGRYADSAVRQMGSTSSYGAQGGYNSGSSRDYSDAMKYPGSDAPGYSASGTTAAATPYVAAGYGNAAQGYAAQPYQAAYPPQATDIRFPAAGATGMASGYSAVQEQGWSTGGNYALQTPQPRQQEYADIAMSDPPQMQTSRPPNQYASQGVRPAYPGQTAAQYSYQPVTSAAGAAVYQQQPSDAFYGRGGYPATTSATKAFSDSVASPAANPGYSPGQGQDPSYDEPMTGAARPAAAAAGTQAQMAPAANPNRRERERERGGERDREPHDRPRDRDRDRERDRDHRQERDDGQRRKAHHYGR